MQEVLTVPYWGAAPFVVFLLIIALLPLLKPLWWRSHYIKIALGFALLMGLYDVSLSSENSLHTLVDYISFMALLTSLFVVSGGIHISGSIPASPLMNTLMLALGAGLASLIGTTGASMLMIHPLLRVNRHRKNKTHLWIFFILLISNIGGALTPLGDPPLFMGFLQGVDFFWTFKLFPQWIFLISVLCAEFFILDAIHYRKEIRLVQTLEAIRVHGKINFLFLGGILATVILFKHVRTVSPIRYGAEILQISAMALMAFLSLRFGPKTPRRQNEFN